MNRKTFTRVVAIGLALIMVFGVIAVAFPVFAMSPDAALMIADTGDNINRNMIVIGAVIALVVIVALVVVPMFTKNKK